MLCSSSVGKKTGVHENASQIRRGPPHPLPSTALPGKPRLPSRSTETAGKRGAFERKLNRVENVSGNIHRPQAAHTPSRRDPSVARPRGPCPGWWWDSATVEVTATTGRSHSPRGQSGGPTESQAANTPPGSWAQRASVHRAARRGARGRGAPRRTSQPQAAHDDSVQLNNVSTAAARPG